MKIQTIFLAVLFFGLMTTVGFKIAGDLYNPNSGLNVTITEEQYVHEYNTANSKFIADENLKSDIQEIQDVSPGGNKGLWDTVSDTVTGSLRAMGLLFKGPTIVKERLEGTNESDANTGLREKVGVDPIFTNTLFTALGLIVAIILITALLKGGKLES